MSYNGTSDSDQRLLDYRIDDDDSETDKTMLMRKQQQKYLYK